MMKLFLLGLNLLFMFSAQAGNLPKSLMGGMDSGGGKGIVCFTQKNIADKVRGQNRIIYDEDLKTITSIEMLDFKYAKDGLGEQNIFQESNDVINKVLWGKLNLFPVLQHKLIDLFSQIENNTRLRQAPLQGTFDENDIAIYDNGNCVLTQLAVQQDLSNGQFVVHYDARLVNHPLNSVRSQFALKAHEAMYLDLRRNHGDTNSAMTRELVSQLLNNQGQNAEKFIQAFIDAGFLVGAYTFEDGNLNWRTPQLVEAISYFLPNQLVLDAAFNIPYYFNSFDGSFIFELQKVNWNKRASSYLNINAQSSVMFKKLAHDNSKDSKVLKDEYLSILNLSLKNVESTMNKDIEYMLQEYRSFISDENRNDIKFQLMLNNYKKLVQIYAELFVKDSDQITKYNLNLPYLSKAFEDMAGIIIYTKVMETSPYVLRQISLENQIPENLSPGNSYQNKLKLLAIYFAMEDYDSDDTLTSNFYESMRIPKI